ncbi:MAG: endonuclease [Verrucomicrobiaceae bacterium]|nr:endonuclease [Verrucomicrobiaceae bacterium]
MARTHGHGNPDWTRDETILALGLYFECEGRVPSKGDERVKALSELLRRFPHHIEASRKESFRNPDGVAFKLQNLRSVATGKGLGNVSEMDRSVWAEFQGDPAAATALAGIIQSEVELATVEKPNVLEEEEFYEGKVATQAHFRRERSRKLRNALFTMRRRKRSLLCDLCQQFSLSEEPCLRDAMFEVHHIVLLAATGETRTRLSDLALLCANCHRLLHRAIAVEKRWIGIPEARAKLGFAHG